MKSPDILKCSRLLHLTRTSITFPSRSDSSTTLIQLKLEMYRIVKLLDIGYPVSDRIFEKTISSNRISDIFRISARRKCLFKKKKAYREKDCNFASTYEILQYNIMNTHTYF